MLRGQVGVSISEDASGRPGKKPSPALSCRIRPRPTSGPGRCPSAGAEAANSGRHTRSGADSGQSTGRQPPPDAAHRGARTGGAVPGRPGAGGGPPPPPGPPRRERHRGGAAEARLRRPRPEECRSARSMPGLGMRGARSARRGRASGSTPSISGRAHTPRRRRGGRRRGAGSDPARQPSGRAVRKPTPRPPLLHGDTDQLSREPDPHPKEEERHDGKPGGEAPLEPTGTPVPPEGEEER